MSERNKKEKSAVLTGPGSASVDALASRALSLVAERNQHADTQIDPTFAEQLHSAAAVLERNTVPEVVENMLNHGIAAEAIAVHYIPYVARLMGDEWCEDSLSFSHVTIGTARLQSALRSLGKDWWHDARANDTGEGSGVVVVLVKDAYHTLGVNVLAGQLRRLGHSVRLAMGPSPQDLKAVFRKGRFDAVMISASASESLEFLREYVESVKQSAPGNPPIVVGGGIMGLDVDVKSATGADFATNDLFEALEHCGLTKAKRMETAPTGQRS